MIYLPLECIQYYNEQCSSDLQHLPNLMTAPTTVLTQAVSKPSPYMHVYHMVCVISKRCPGSPGYRIYFRMTASTSCHKTQPLLTNGCSTQTKQVVSRGCLMINRLQMWI